MRKKAERRGTGMHEQLSTAGPLHRATGGPPQAGSRARMSRKPLVTCMLLARNCTFRADGALRFLSQAVAVAKLVPLKCYGKVCSIMFLPEGFVNKTLRSTSREVDDTIREQSANGRNQTDRMLLVVCYFR